MRIHQEDGVLLDSLVDLCTDAALQDELESLEVGRVHLNDGSHVTCLLLHGLYGDLKRCGEEQFSSQRSTSCFYIVEFSSLSLSLSLSPQPH